MMDDPFNVTQVDAPEDPPEPWPDPADDPTGWPLPGPVHSDVVDDLLEVFSQGQSVTLLDVDHSGRWDVAILDLNNDGAPDLLIGPEGDGFLVAVDTTGDGAFNHAELLSRDEVAPEILTFLETSPLPVEVDPSGFDPVTVTEVEASEYWFHQAAPGLCVPASVAQLVSAYTGMPFADESAFVALANDLGLFSVGMDGIGGMTPPQALYLMEAAGVPASLVVSSSLDMLDNYLDKGHGVMLFVDSGQVWDGVPNGVLDHALVITEIDHDQGLVVLADPGHPQGNGLVLSIEDFEQAWAAGENQMIIGEQPVPDHDLGMGQPVTTTGVPDLAAASDPTGQPAAATNDTSPIDIQELIENIRGEHTNGTEQTPSVQELLDHARTETPNLELSDLVTDRIASPQTQLQQVTQYLVRRPWILLPVAIAANRLFAR